MKTLFLTFALFSLFNILRADPIEVAKTGITFEAPEGFEPLAKEIIALNRKKEKVASLEEYATELVEEAKAEFENVVGQDSLTRFDSPKPAKKRRNNRNNKRRKKPQNKKNDAK